MLSVQSLGVLLAGKSAENQVDILSYNNVCPSFLDLEKPVRKDFKIILFNDLIFI